MINKEVSTASRPKISPCITLLLLTIILSACTGVLQPTSIPATPVAITPTPGSEKVLSEVHFSVRLAQPLPDDGKIFLNILDEVTGLALNPQRVELIPSDDGAGYTVTLPFEIGTVIKYRFTRDGATSAVEYTPLGEQVRYRIFRVDGPSEVIDTISAWNDQPYNGEFGRITGTVTSTGENRPTAGLLVTAAGVRTLTASDGTFVLEGIPAGTHNLFVYTLDGSYETFQQGATVVAGKTTPASISLTPSTFVNITFNVAIPVENIVGLPVRMAGNLYQTGNTFSDLDGGLSVVSTRMPLLNQGGNGLYSLTLSLPAGADFRYKYSLGDGFWNSEQNAGGGFTLRNLIVPDTDQVVNDVVATWGSTEAGAITFSMQAPPSTPPGDFISIQFNPYSWTEPIPIWAMGNNQWMYILYSPLNLISNMGYRYCRNGQCGSADEAGYPGPDNPGRQITISKDAQTFQDSVEAWQWWQPTGEPTTVVAADIQPRGNEFVAGFEFTPSYQPVDQIRFLPAFQAIRQIGANWVVIDPTWTVSSSISPVIAPLPGTDLSWTDVISILQDGSAQGLQTALYPRLNFGVDPNTWWTQASRSAGWWDTWFSRYKSFLINFADAAAASNATALIIGGDPIAPALPSGLLSDGSSSGVPDDAENRWLDIIATVRQHFSGRIFWAAEYTSGLSSIPDFASKTDGLYLLWSAHIASDPDPIESDLDGKIGSILDEEIAPISEVFGGHVILGVSYNSANGAASGCIKVSTGECVLPENINPPNPDNPGVTLDLQEQVDIYNALLSAVNQRPWINGLVSRDFNYGAAIQDKSASVNGKPAQDVIWYWFPGLIAE